MMWNKTIASPATGGRWFWPAWGAAFLGFPIGGAAATLLVGPIESVGAALIAGAVAGGVIGAAQWLVLRRRIPLSALWVAVTAGGMAVGMALGQVLLGDNTTMQPLLLRGLVQITMFLVLVMIHFGLLIGGYRHPAAGTTESVIAAVLVFGLLLTWTPPPWSRRAATAAQSFGTLGVVVGLFTIALGIGPRTILDITLNVVLLLTLIAGVASTKRGARHVQAARMTS